MNTTSETINDIYNVAKDKKRCVQDIFDQIMNEIISFMRRSYHAIIDPDELAKQVSEEISQKEHQWKEFVDIVGGKDELKDIPDLNILVLAIRLYSATYGNVFNLPSIINEGNRIAVCLAYHMKHIPLLSMVDFPINEDFLLGCVVKLHDMNNDNAEKAISIIMGWIYRNRVRLDDIKFDLANFDQATYMLFSKYDNIDELVAKYKDFEFNFDEECAKYGIQL